VRSRTIMHAEFHARSHPAATRHRTSIVGIMGLMHNAVICHRENNMLFNSSQLGTVEVDESTIINFAQGIPALENCTQFKLFHNADSANPSVFWMQSLTTPASP
jgi:Tfp pilus assembly protein PilW